MAYPTNYSGWINFIKDILDVDNFTDDRIGYFLSLAQTRLNRELNSQWMEKDGNLTFVTPSTGVSIISTLTDFNRISLVVPGTGNPPLDTLAFNEYKFLVGQNSAGGQIPTNFSIFAQKLYVYPLPVAGDIFDIFYYMMVPEISGSLASNIFTQYHPDALTYAAVLEGSRFIVEDERIPTWNDAYNQAIDMSNLVAGQSKMGSTPLKRDIKLYGVQR